MKRWISPAAALLALTMCIGICCVGESDNAYSETKQKGGESRKIDGSGDVVKLGVDVAGFTGVHLATIGTVYIDFGKTENLVIEAEDNLIDYFVVKVEGGTLKIDKRRNTSLRAHEPIRFYVTVRTLDAIALSSSGDAVVPDVENDEFAISLSSSGDLEMGKLKTAHLEASLSSSGDADIEGLSAKSIDVSLSSSGDLWIGGGKVSTQNVSLSSSGDYDARKLQSTGARVRLSSSGDAYIWVIDDLVASVSSSGSVHYVGEPAVKQSTSSSGRVKRIK